MAQQTDTQLTTLSDAIANETVPGGITKEEVAALLKHIIDSKPNNDLIETSSSFATSGKSIAGRDAVKGYIDNSVLGLWDDRGNYNASGNSFPSTGGSGTGGAILKGDVWTISTGGTLGGNPVVSGQTVRALVDTPGSTAGNWAISAVGSGSSTPDASTTVAGKVEQSTSTEVKSGSTSGGSGAPLFINPTDLKALLFPDPLTLTSGSTVPWSTSGAINNNASLAIAHAATFDVTGVTGLANGYCRVTNTSGSSKTLNIPAATSHVIYGNSGNKQVTIINNSSIVICWKTIDGTNFEWWYQSV